MEAAVALVPVSGLPARSVALPELTHRAGPAAVFNHQLREPLSIDNNNPLDRSCKFHGLSCKPGGRDENALRRALSCKRTVEPLHFRPADRLLPPFGLDVHFLKAEFVKRDDSVNAAITNATDTLQVGPAGTVPHAVHNIEHDGFEKRR